MAFALAGRVDIDLTREPLGIGDDGRPVFLADVWPSPDEIRSVIGSSISPDLFRATYATVFEGDDRWRALPIPAGDRFAWDPASTYLARPPFLEGVPAEPAPVERHRRCAGPGRPRRLGHDRPHLAGRLDRAVVAGRPVAPGPRRRPARVQLVRRPARPARGDDPRARSPTSACATGWSRARRGRTRSTCPTARRRSSTTPPSATRPRACRCWSIAGREYGSGSSRDWAAKGTALLGVRAVLAESYERIHRSNLVGMGVLPLQFLPGESAASLGLTGREAYTVAGLAGGPAPRSTLTVTARADDGAERRFEVDRPARRPDRGRLLPPRRHPAGGPAPARGGRPWLSEPGSSDITHWMKACSSPAGRTRSGGRYWIRTSDLADVNRAL